MLNKQVINDFIKLAIDNNTIAPHHYQEKTSNGALEILMVLG